MRNLKHILSYCIAPILALIVFCVFFQIWNLDLTQPIFAYSGDSLSHLFIVKNITETGWIFSNPSVGLPHLDGKFYIHDAPIHADAFNFLIFKIIAGFTSNVFLIVNVFFIFTFVLIAATAFIALRSFNISVFSASLVSVLYAFLPYHLLKNVQHLFLSNYAAIPLVVMVAMWIITDKIRLIARDDKARLNLKPNTHFFYCLLIALFIATNGIYYAFYACIFFIFAWFIRSLRKGKFFTHSCFTAASICTIICITLLCIYIPAFVYWIQHGANQYVTGRSASESQHFGLKFYNLLLPISHHYLDCFRSLRAAFDIFAQEGENAVVSLGFFSAMSFLFLLLWVIASNHSKRKSIIHNMSDALYLTKKEKETVSNLASLNLLSLLFAMTGGLVMFFAIVSPLIRSHARFAIFIAFLALSFIALVFDKLIERKIFNHKIFAQLAIIIIFTLSLFDQIGLMSAKSIQNNKMQQRFTNDSEFVALIENKVPKQSQIFILPYIPFPERGSYEPLTAYLHSKELLWSYPAMFGRASSVWQEQVVDLEFKDFIAQIKEMGFMGIYLDKSEYEAKYGVESLDKMEKMLNAYCQKPALVSNNGHLLFFDLG